MTPARKGAARVIDVHGHAGAWQQYGWYDRTPKDGIAWVLRAMDRAGVDQQCLFTIFHGDARKCNRDTHEFVRTHPDRFIGFAFATPLYPEECRDALVEAIDEFGFKAIKIYPPYARIPVTDVRWEPIFTFAQERGLPVLSHTSAEDPLCGVHLFPEVAKRYPAVSWILGHAGGSYEGRAAACRSAQAAPNIYLEICGSNRDPGSIEQLVAGAGAERVLLGSDNPLIDPRIHLGRVLLADLTNAQKRLILGENAARLLKV